MKTADLPIFDVEEPAGTILVGSTTKRTYLFVSQSAERMKHERMAAAQAGVKNLREFVFVLDGQVVELTYDQLKARLMTPNAQDHRPAEGGSGASQS